ncbi:MAG: anti-sigma F factor [Clostridiales bacterium]|nr:anti-sigma F factor [Clostridiales bacterium]MCD7828110.1 anti-sigma F factor [Clostridiales bacterium]
MNTINEIKLTVPAKSVNEGYCRIAVASFASQADPTVEIISDIKTVVSEAVTNCIVHAYRECTGKIYITAQITQEDMLVVKIRDKGVGIPNIKQAREPLFTTGGSDRSGLGFSVMESFSDKLKVASKEGKGTTVTFYKKLRNG